MLAPDQGTPGGDLLRWHPVRHASQWVRRTGPGFRACSGLFASGRQKPAEALRLAASVRAARAVRRVAFHDGLPLLGTCESVTLALHSEIDVSQGDAPVAGDAAVKVAGQFGCNTGWMHLALLLAGSAHLTQLSASTVKAAIKQPMCKVHVNTQEPVAPKMLMLKEAGACMLQFALRRAHNVHPQRLETDQGTCAAPPCQQPLTMWFTRLAAAGKGARESLLTRHPRALVRDSCLFDGGSVRHDLWPDPGFTEASRVDNGCRVVELARLMAGTGLKLFVCLLSPACTVRSMAQPLLQDLRLVEVHAQATLELAGVRDLEGWHVKTRCGGLRHSVGACSKHAVAEHPALRHGTKAARSSQAAGLMLAHMRAAQRQ